MTKTVKEQKTKISRNRKQIILEFSTGLAISHHESKDEDGPYDQIDFSFQVPQKGGTKKLDPLILKALESLHGRGGNGDRTIKNIKVVINAKRKVPK